MTYFLTLRLQKLLHGPALLLKLSQVIRNQVQVLALRAADQDGAVMVRLLAHHLGRACVADATGVHHGVLVTLAAHSRHVTEGAAHAGRGACRGGGGGSLVRAQGPPGQSLQTRNTVGVAVTVRVIVCVSEATAAGGEGREGEGRGGAQGQQRAGERRDPGVAARAQALHGGPHGRRGRERRGEEKRKERGHCWQKE
jgi:hypothetical protein